MEQEAKSLNSKQIIVLQPPDKKQWGVKVLMVSYLSVLTFVLGAQRIHLIEMVLFNYTHPQYMVGGEIRFYF